MNTTIACYVTNGQSTIVMTGKTSLPIDVIAKNQLELGEDDLEALLGGNG